MDQTPRNRAAASFFETIQHDLRIGLICPRSADEIRDDPVLEQTCSAVLELVDRSRQEDRLPRMRLVAGCGSLPKGLLRQQDAGLIPLYEDIQAMLAAHPEINLIIELTGSPETLSNLRQSLPPTIALVDRPSAVFLRGLLALTEASGRCETDLQGSRNLLNTIVDELPDDIFFLDGQGRILDVNRQACQRHGLDKQALLQQPISAIPAGPGQVSCGSVRQDWPFLATMAHQKESETLQTWMDEHGRVHYYQVTTYPVFNADGQIHRVIELRRDVTLRTDMEKRLLQAEKLASIGELSMYIAHEIRNPLFAIGGFANALLRSTELSENSREKVRIILEESRRLDKILKNLINFARPTTSDPTAVDVNQVVAETMQVLGIGSEERGVDLDIRLAADVPKARANTELLKQCLINLVRNALEAMPHGGRLSVTTAMERQQVLITVTDTGGGIPAEIRDKIFNPFFSTKKTESGAGLGLAMTRKIISDLGGDVRLSSQPNKGTSVSLLLQPFASSAEKREEPAGRP